MATSREIDAVFIAAQMTGKTVKELNGRFIQYLEDINRLAESLGGKLNSRQVIAKAIIDFEYNTGIKLR